MFAPSNIYLKKKTFDLTSLFQTLNNEIELDYLGASPQKIEHRVIDLEKLSFFLKKNYLNKILLSYSL